MKMKMKKSTARQITKDYVKDSPIRRELEINDQTIQILFSDPDFTDWVRTMRKHFNIPAGGLKSKSPELKKWLSTLDEKGWNKELRGIYAKYTKVNEALMPYVEGYVKFGELISEPMHSYRVYIPQSGDKKDHRIKHRKIGVEIYFPLSDKEWTEVRTVVSRYFDSLETSHAKPVKLERKTLSLQAKRKIEAPLYTAEVDRQSKETDLSLIESKYPNAPPNKTEKMARNLPKDRERMKKLLKQRLGKV